MFKTNTFKLLLLVGISSLGLPLFLSFFPPQRGIAQENSCQVEENNRKLPSSIPASKLNAEIESVMKEADLEGEIELIIWADGVQIYNYSNGQPKIFAPLANLYPVENFDDELYILMNDPIGNHDQVGDSPAWEFFDGQRFIAQEKIEIEGAGEQDVPRLAVRTDQKDYYILRLGTQGGTAPDCRFEGLLGVPYQSLYVLVKTNGSQASQSSVINK